MARNRVCLRWAHRHYRNQFGAFCTGRDGTTLATDRRRVTCEDCLGKLGFVGPIHPDAGWWRKDKGLRRPWLAQPYWGKSRRQVDVW